MSKEQDVLVFPDIHVPVEDKQTMRAVLRYTKDRNPDQLVILGDYMELGMISSYVKSDLRAISGKTIKRDFYYGNKLLDQIQEAAPKAAITLLEGNHDFRMETYINAHPVLEGTMEVPVLLKLKERGIRWVPNWSTGEIYKIGKAHFSHGVYEGPHHAKTHADNFGINYFYGHIHDVQLHSKVFHGDNSTVVAQSMGCLCDYKQEYIRGKPTKWQQAFGVFKFRRDGFFNYSTVMIFNHAFYSPEGVWYDGKRK